MIGFLSLTTSAAYIVITYFTERATWFNIIDIIVCVVFLMDFMMGLYVSQRRFQDFISLDTAVELIIIFPILVFPNSTQEYAVFLVALSRLLRIIKAGRVFSKYFYIGDTDVAK